MIRSQGPNYSLSPACCHLRVAMCCLLLALVSAPSLLASEACQRDVSARPTVGLVLGGGGARGSAHIGVIRVLEEMNIPVDYIAGTSMGALVGALLATGMDADELERVMLDIDWDKLFEDETDRREEPFRRKRDDDLALFGPKFGIGESAALLPAGAISGQKINFLFETLVKQRTRVNDFDQLPVPFRAVATDLVTGNQVVLQEGDLALAMRASMSVPGLFDPVAWGDYLLADGGLTNNVPIDVVRAMGADIVIAVSVGSGLTPRERLTDVLSIAGQLTNFMTNTNTATSLATLAPRDVLIAPALGDTVTSAAFDKVREGMAIGYEAASGARDALGPLAIAPRDYRTYRQSLSGCVSPPRRIDFVRLENNSRFKDEVIEGRITVREGDALDVEVLRSDVAAIYGLGFLDRARYQLVEEEGGTGVVFEVAQDPRGTQLIETGLDVSDGEEGSAYNFRLGYLNTALDGYGSELRVLAQVGEDPALLGDLYKYFDPQLEWYIQTQLFAERRNIAGYDEDGNTRLIARIDQAGGLLGFGREFGRSARVGLGVRLFTGESDVRVGPPLTEAIDFDGGEYLFNGNFDRLDDPYFPGEGALVNFIYVKADESLGADTEYEQLIFESLAATTRDRHSFLGALRYYDTVNGDAPLYALFRAGGFGNLSGLQYNELAGPHYGMVMGGYRYHVAGSGLLPAYLGGTLEYGQVADDAGDLLDDGILNGSVYFGYRSPIGPLYIGAGFAEGGRATYFIRVGNIFSRSGVSRQ